MGDPNTYDVAVVGGGPAGLSAALVLGRARRNVLVFDSGRPRNERVTASAGFFTRDGTPPGVLLSLGRKQLHSYAVQLEPRSADLVHVGDAGLLTVTSGGYLFHCRRLLLATGIADELPPIPGLNALWGHLAVQCPYCHGWEIRDRPIWIFGNDQETCELCVLLTVWTRDIVVLTDGTPSFGAACLARLRMLNIPIVAERLVQTRADGDAVVVTFASGREEKRSGLFLTPQIKPRNELALLLGCQTDIDGAIHIDKFGNTTVTNVYAAGEVTGHGSQVITAAAHGSKVARAINGSLLVEHLNQINSS